VIPFTGANPGLGSVSAAVDPDNVIPESNETNNAETLPVTVK
jgi:subtilase family serine protease